jgi:hypothetical protein
MTRANTMIRTLRLGVSLLALALPVAAQAVSVNLVSGTDLTVLDNNMTPVGNAQNVCLTAMSPSNCPRGATVYQYPYPSWRANLSSIPGATWVWAPNLTGTTSPAANQTFHFQTSFWLCGDPQPGTISIASDNTAVVTINGNAVPTPALTPDALANISIPASMLHIGPNVIDIAVTNGPNPADCGSDQYRCNPAGVVFGASFKDALNAWPTCSDHGTTYNAGDHETVACASPLVGNLERYCGCVGSVSFWTQYFGSCVTPQPTCTDNGRTFHVGDTEPLSCPPGWTGSKTNTCQADGWHVTGICFPPALTCTGNNGSIFQVNGVETTPCTPPLVGSLNRTCLQNGTWGPSTNNCHFLDLCAGCMCARDRGLIWLGNCPIGTSCTARRGSGNPPLWTTDWYCDP